jgi:hypothetical protein
LLVAFVLAGCAVPGTGELSPTQRAPNVAEFLSRIRTQGAALGCNPEAVQAVLGGRLSAPRTGRQNDIYREDYELRPSADTLLGGGGEYSRFRSSTTSVCQITIDIPPGALCDVHSAGYGKAVGASPVPYHPPHPPRSQTPDTQVFHLFGAADARQRDEAWLSLRHGDRCVYRVIVRTHGSFKEAR